MPKRKAQKRELDDESDLLQPTGDASAEATLTNGSASPAKRRKIKTETVERGTIEPKTEKPKRECKQKVKTEVDVDEEGVRAESTPKQKQKQKQKRMVQEEVVPEIKGEQGNAQDGEGTEKKVTRKRKTKEEREAEAMPLAARAVGHKLHIGAHVSAAGGVQNAVANSVHIGANCFALFLKSQRKWANPPLVDEQCTAFHANCEQHSYDQTRHVVPHGSYLVNLAHTDPARTAQAYDSYLDDLQRCERLGIRLYNIHPGNTARSDRQQAIAHLAANINRAHAQTSSVVTLLENMAAGGNVLGSTFEDLRDIIALVADQARVGVCLDTCHAFAAGYDLRSPAAFRATLAHFDATVGLPYLRALHLNDSKAPLHSHRDLHANIGTGFLGLRAFHNIVNEPRLAGLPLVLETPITVRDDEGNVVLDERQKEKEDRGIWAGEIKMLEGLVGMDVDGDEFRELEARLARRGESERRRLAGQMERKREKEEKMEKKKQKQKKTVSQGKKVAGKGKRKKEEEEEADEESSRLSSEDGDEEDS